MGDEIAITPALKSELEYVHEREQHGTLNETVHYLLTQPMPGAKPLDGEEGTLSESVWISPTTKSVLRKRKRQGGYDEYENVIRDCAGVMTREVRKPMAVE